MTNINIRIRTYTVTYVSTYVRTPVYRYMHAGPGVYYVAPGWGATRTSGRLGTDVLVPRLVSRVAREL